MPNYLSNVAGYGASQEAAQAKAALLQNAIQQAGFRTGNENNNAAAQKYIALAQLGLQSKNAEADRQMKKYLADQAMAIEQQKLGQQNAQFGQQLGAQKENLGMELGSKEKIAAAQQAIDAHLADIKDKYDQAMADNDKVRADALANEYNTAATNAKAAGLRAEEEFQNSTGSLKRSIIGQIRSQGGQGTVGTPGQNAPANPPQEQTDASDPFDTSKWKSPDKFYRGDAIVPIDTSIQQPQSTAAPMPNAVQPRTAGGTLLTGDEEADSQSRLPGSIAGAPGPNSGGSIQDQIALVNQLDTGVSPDMAREKLRALKTQNDLAETAAREKANEIAGIVSPTEKRRAQELAGGEATSGYTAMLTDPSIQPDTAMQTIMNKINNDPRFYGKITPLDESFFGTRGPNGFTPKPGLAPLVSTSPQGIRAALGPAGFQDISQLEEPSLNDVALKYNNDKSGWAIYNPLRVIGGIFGSRETAPYLPTLNAQTTPQDRTYTKNFILSDQDLRSKFINAIRKRVKLPDPQEKALFTELGIPADTQQ